jgi:hypothetical protein
VRVLGEKNKKLRQASPIVFGQRIPDFLSRLVALSRIMWLALREAHAWSG